MQIRCRTLCRTKQNPYRTLCEVCWGFCKASAIGCPPQEVAIEHDAVTLNDGGAGAVDTAGSPDQGHTEKDFDAPLAD